MATIKIPKEVKLKNLPLESRVALRLVTIREHHQTRGSLRAIAKELGAKFKEVMTAVESLAKQRVIQLTPIDINDFDFEISMDVRRDLRLNASNFDKHLKIQAEKMARAKQSGTPAPAHLPPITAEQRQPWMEKATQIATHLGVPKLAFKIANCIVRMGEKDVDAILEAVLRARKATPDPAMSAVRMFFTLYVAQRDARFSPAQKVA
jgi:hypothetical protein